MNVRPHPAIQRPILDLSFVIDDDLPLPLLLKAGCLAEPAQAEDCWSTLLACWLEDLATELPQRLQAQAFSLGLRLTDDVRMAGLNDQWRGKAGSTDVLAFAAQEAAPPMPCPVAAIEPAEIELGDIIISLDTAARQASAAGQGLVEELLFLASHGLLHLVGWDHPDDSSLEAMLDRQQRLIRAHPLGSRQ